MKTYEIESFIPVFSGFYNTGFDIFEYMDEEDNERLDNGDVEIDYDAFNRDASVVLSDIVENVLRNNGINLNVIPQDIISPKYYNYSNDCANCIYEVDNEVILKIISIVIENYDLFDDYLKRKYTSCSGFISSYPNDPKDWLVFDEIISSSHLFGSILEFLLVGVFGFNESEMMMWFCDEMWYGDYLVETSNNEQDEEA